MRCPNCHSVVGNNYGICQYCGYDIGTYVRMVQDNGEEIQGERNREPTQYAKREALKPEYNYETGYIYYKAAYEKEKKRNEKYRQNALYAAGAVVLLLHIVELLFLAAIYTL